MNYTKPEVVLNANAVAVIKGQTGKTAIALDQNTVDHIATPAAYEADE